MAGGQGAEVRDQAEVTPLPVAAARTASAAANVSGLPATAPTDGGEAVRPVAQGATVGISQQTQERRGVTAPIMGHPVPVGKAVPVVKPVSSALGVKAPATAVEVAAVTWAPGRWGYECAYVEANCG